MDWITEQIAIGTKEEALDPELLRGHGIRSVLNVHGRYAEDDATRPGVEPIVTIPLVDDYGNDPALYRQAVDALALLVGSHAPVLVHCKFGMSRSPAVVAGYLVRSAGVTGDQAIDMVAAKRSVTAIFRPLVHLVYSMMEGFDPSAKRIEVWLSRQQLLAFDGQIPVFSFACVSGDDSHPTPSGPGKILSKHRLYTHPRSNARVGFAMTFAGTGEAIHQSHAPGPLSLLNSPGRRAVESHGCVQLAAQDAAALFEWALLGTSVLVH